MNKKKIYINEKIYAYEIIDNKVILNESLEEEIVRYIIKGLNRIDSKINKGKMLYQLRKKINSYRLNINDEDLDAKLKEIAMKIAYLNVKRDNKEYIKGNPNLEEIEKGLDNSIFYLEIYDNVETIQMYLSALNMRLEKILNSEVNRIKDNTYNKNVRILSEAIYKALQENIGNKKNLTI